MAGAEPLLAVRRALLLAVTVVLATTGCGTLRAAEPKPLAPGAVTTAPAGLTPGPYALTTAEGAVITFDLPTVPPPDEEVEQLRKALNVEPVTYVELHIDNTEGTRTVQFDDLKVISHEGGQFPFQPAADVLADWDPSGSPEGGLWRADGTPLDPQEGAVLDARLQALITEYTGPVPPGVVGRELMIGEFDHLPETFDDVELSPYPHERALDPAPVGHGPVERRYRPGVPSGKPGGSAGQEQPQSPAVPADPAPQPPQPTTAPEPAYVPDCTNPASPSDPAQQSAWNAACVPAPEPTAPVPPPQPVPVPTAEPTQPTQPTAEPTEVVAQPVPSSTATTGQGAVDGGAVDGGTVDGGTVQLADAPAATASPSPSPRRSRPTRSASPAPAASVPAGAVVASSLPTGAPAA